MTRFASEALQPVTFRRLRWDRIGPSLLLALVVLVVAACAAPGAPASIRVGPTARRRRPARRSSRPSPAPTRSASSRGSSRRSSRRCSSSWSGSTSSWGLGVPAAIGWAIVALTLIVRAIVIPLYRRQLVSQRRMQLLQPEIKEIQQRYKGDAMKARLAQQELFKERGISPLAGCLPLLLQMPLLFIMYSVIQNGLTNVDPTAMLDGLRRPGRATCQCNNINPATGVPDAALGPCIDTVDPVPRDIDVSQPSTIFSVTIVGFVLGISILAIVSAALQLVQSRMMLPSPTRPRRPEHPDPAPDDAVPAAHLGRLRRVPAGGPVHLLDHGHDLLDRRSSTSSSVGAGCSRCSAGRRASRPTTRRDSRCPCPHHPSPASARPS